jgi:hypothetical protein
MKILMLFCSWLLVQSDNWVIFLNGKEWTRGSDKPKSIVWKGSKKDKLRIEYHRQPSNIKWKRNFVFTTTRDSILSTCSFTYADGTFEIPASAITGPLAQLDTIKLHTEEHPADDQMMVRSKMQPLLVITKK